MIVSCISQIHCALLANIKIRFTANFTVLCWQPKLPVNCRKNLWQSFYSGMFLNQAKILVLLSLLYTQVLNITCSWEPAYTFQRFNWQNLISTNTIGWLVFTADVSVTIVSQMSAHIRPCKLLHISFFHTREPWMKTPWSNLPREFYVYESDNAAKVLVLSMVVFLFPSRCPGLYKNA